MPKMRGKYHWGSTGALITMLATLSIVGKISQDMELALGTAFILSTLVYYISNKMQFEDISFVSLHSLKKDKHWGQTWGVITLLLVMLFIFINTVNFNRALLYGFLSGLFIFITLGYLQEKNKV